MLPVLPTSPDDIPIRILDAGKYIHYPASVDDLRNVTRRMVIKPLEFLAKGQRGVVQPAVKCGGREYLRIIYRPEYTMTDHLDRLRTRGVARKRALAWREFALGIEALERFVRQEPLYRVHECVFGIVALASEPVDPRL